jgi:hypothetical protein
MSLALDVGIGLVFLYLLLALLVTTLQELAASVLSLRAKQLYDTIAGMIEGKPGDPFVEQLYGHPLIKNLSDRSFVKGARDKWIGGGLPSYIPSKTFTLAFLDLLRGKAASNVTGADQALTGARELVATLPFPDLKKTLELLLDSAERLEQDVDKQAQVFSAHIEQWFNDRMARASGWYKRKAQLISFVLALGVSIVCNASTFKVADRLWHDSSLRASVVASAQSFHSEKDAKVDVGALAGSNLPIGWHGMKASGSDLILIPLGWLTTALAVSLGSSFWFDLLGKALSIRGTGTKVSTTSGKVEG